MAAVLLVMVALIVAACDRTYSEIEVEIRDDGIELHQTTVPEGAITLRVRNEGIRPHELIVLNTQLAPDSLPVAGERVDLGSVGPSEGSIDKKLLLPGRGNNRTFKLGKGSYVLISNLPGDYQAGVFAGLEVVEDSGVASAE